MNRILILALTTMLLLSACGQKGALYLPEEPPEKTLDKQEVSETEEKTSEN